MDLCIAKFGGVALENALGVRRVGDLVRRQGGRQVLVVSALKGVTQSLGEACDAAARGVLAWDGLRVRHRTMLRQLELPGDLLDRHLHSLRALLEHMAAGGCVNARQRDHVLSFGERMSARIVAAHLRSSGQSAAALDAFDLGLIHRPEQLVPATILQPDRDQLRRRLKSIVGVAVVTGFVAVDSVGDLTTLGPNGSDLTATWMAEALGADEVHLWKGVDGIHTADPALVAKAQPLPKIGWDDAAALARHGADVLHPAAGEPARRAGIPVRVRSIFRPDSPGTLVEGDGSSAPCPIALVGRRRVALMTISLGKAKSGDSARSSMEALGLCLEAKGIQPYSMHSDSRSVALLVPDIEGLEVALDRDQSPGVSLHGGFSALTPIGREVENDSSLAELLEEIGGSDSIVLPIRPGSRGRTLLLDRASFEIAASRLHEVLFPGPASVRPHSPGNHPPALDE